MDYKNTPIFNDFYGRNCVVDVRTVDVKGQKRKLLKDVKVVKGRKIYDICRI